MKTKGMVIVFKVESPNTFLSQQICVCWATVRFEQRA